MEPLKRAFVLFAVTIYSTVESGLDLSPNIANRFMPHDCITINGKAGKCVNELYCSEEHVIIPGGIIDDSELREKVDPRKACANNDWCCTLEEEQVVVPKTTNGCTIPDTDVCPWCVSIHVGNTTKGRLACLGAMITSRMVLTASTCIAAGQRKNMWVRVPQSAQPERDYQVSYRYAHNSYDSGTHQNDFGFLVLEKDVEWNSKNWKGACLGLQIPLVGECVAYGLDRNNKIISTLLNVRKGACNKGGDVPDAACGTVFDNGSCATIEGSPVICAPDKKNGIILGVVRGPCLKKQVLLGRIDMSASWLSEKLKEKGILPAYYELSKQ